MIQFLTCCKLAAMPQFIAGSCQYFSLGRVDSAAGLQCPNGGVMMAQGADCTDSVSLSIANVKDGAKGQ